MATIIYDDVMPCGRPNPIGFGPRLTASIERRMCLVSRPLAKQCYIKLGQETLRPVGRPGSLRRNTCLPEKHHKNHKNHGHTVQVVISYVSAANIEEGDEF